MRIAVLASGSGTILESILDDGIPVELVVVDRECLAVEVAERHAVDVVHVERASYGDDFDRDAYTIDVRDALLSRSIELVVMAGYGTILGQAMFDAFPGRVLNTHPSLLPAFPGWHAVEEALAHGVKVTGCTVHVATAEVDAGPILAQRPVAVRDDDSVDDLHERIKEVERMLYPETIRVVLAEADEEATR